MYAAVMKLEQPKITDKMSGQIKEWLKSICNPQFSLIDALVQMFVDSKDNKAIQSKILKVLKKLNEHLPEMVGPQFFSNKDFPATLVEYIVSTPLEEIAGDCFILLINLFQDKDAHIYSKEFVEKL